MQPEWNPAYAREAREIAASVIAESGDEWGAHSIRKGEADSADETIIAMRALMVARGEYNLAGEPQP